MVFYNRPKLNGRTPIEKEQQDRILTVIRVIGTGRPGDSKSLLPYANTALRLHQDNCPSQSLDSLRRAAWINN
jgi:hypothetical protein